MMHLEIKISDKLRDEDWRSIEVFQKRALQLLNTAIVKEQQGIHSEIKWKLGKEFQTQSTLPSEENLQSLFMAFRCFYHEGEDSHFGKVANIIKRYSQDDRAYKHIDSLKEQWSGALYSRTINFKANGKKVTSALLLDAWFNAHYFHSDKNVEPLLQELNAALTPELNKFLLANAVYEASKAIVKLYDCIKALTRPGQAISP